MGAKLAATCSVCLSIVLKTHVDIVTYSADYVHTCMYYHVMCICTCKMVDEPPHCIISVELRTVDDESLQGARSHIVYREQFPEL